MAKKLKKLLKKVLPIAALGLGAAALGRRGKTPYRNVHETGAITQTPGRERWYPGVGGETFEPHITRVRTPKWTGDQTMTSGWPMSYKKGGRVTGIAKRGFGRALMKGKK